MGTTSAEARVRRLGRAQVEERPAKRLARPQLGPRESLKRGAGEERSAGPATAEVGGRHDHRDDGTGHGFSRRRPAWP